MRHRRSFAFLGLLTLSLAAGCSRPPVHQADVIYIGGDIITMNDSRPTAEAVAVKDGKILAVGTRPEVEKEYKGNATKIVDLAGKTLLPGFLDAHSHYFSSLTVASQCNLYPPPAGPGKDVPSIIQALTKFRDENDPRRGDHPGVWLRRERDA